MPHHAAHALLTIGAVLAALSSIHGASYTFTTINVPDALSVSAFGINDRGQIVGSYLDASVRNHGFLWNEGVFSTIDFPGAITTVATGINARGQIVGTYDFFAPWTTAGFLWDRASSRPSMCRVPSIPISAGSMRAAKSWASTATAPGWRMAFCGRRVCLRRSMSPMPARPCPGGSTDSARSQATTSMPVSGSTVFSWTRGCSPRSTSRVPPSVSRPESTTAVKLWAGPIPSMVFYGTTECSPRSISRMLQGPNVIPINNRGAIAGSHLSPGRTHGFVALLTDERPPTVTVSTIPTEVWPPNGKLATVAVSGTIADDSGGAGVNLGSAVYEVVDEYRPGSAARQSDARDGRPVHVHRGARGVAAGE